jgi:hypothetical protein
MPYWHSFICKEILRSRQYVLWYYVCIYIYAHTLINKVYSKQYYKILFWNIKSDFRSLKMKVTHFTISLPFLPQNKNRILKMKRNTSPYTIGTLALATLGQSLSGWGQDFLKGAWGIISYLTAHRNHPWACLGLIPKGSTLIGKEVRMGCSPDTGRGGFKTLPDDSST